MAKWSLERIKLPLKVNWSISRGQTAEKENIIVTFREGRLEGKGEAAFLTHGGESVDEVEEQFNDFTSRHRDINGLEDMLEKLHSVDMASNLRFALESSYVHFLAQVMDDSAQRVLGVRAVNKVPTSFSVPHMPSEEVEDYILKHNLARFPSLKIKVKSSDDYTLVKEVGRIFKNPLRIDGNECFSDAKEVLAFCDEIKDQNIEFLEQPLKAAQFDEAVKLREKSPFFLMADEALRDGSVVDDFQRAFHGVNVKLMKAGGYIKAMNQLREARSLGLKTMIGCMVETSLGISSAMNLAHGVDFFDLDGFLLLEEDPFKVIYEENGHLFYSYSH